MNLTPFSSSSRRPACVAFVRARALLLTFALGLLFGSGAGSGALRAQLILPNARILPSERTASVLSVAPDRHDWTYRLGAPASFRIRFDLTPYPAEGVKITYRLGPEMIEGAERETVVPEGGLVLTVTSPTEPGFVRCIVNANVDGKAAEGLATIGFSPEKITPTQTEPADFDAFWSEQKAALAKVAPDYRLEPAPDLSTAEVDSFFLSFQNVGGPRGPSRFYGVLCVPRGPGPFPALLTVPGAGVRPYWGNRYMAAKGFITLEVGVNGIPVNLPKDVYEQLALGPLSGYNRFNLDNRRTYYFRRVHMGCLRAADYLAGHPKWDGRTLIVNGGSQGGQLAIMTAALEPRVTALAASYPAYSDVSGYLHGRAGGWPGLFRKGEDGVVADQPVAAKLETTTYYDTVNFARRVRAPGLYFQGYNDTVCPATSVFAAYNTLPAPKELVLALEQGHATSDAQQDVINKWIQARVAPVVVMTKATEPK